MTSYDIKGKLKYFEKYDIPQEKKLQFIEQLYQLGDMMFDLYLKDGQIKYE